VANDESLESAQTTVGTSALSAVPPLHKQLVPTLALTTRAPAAVSAEAVHDPASSAAPDGVGDCAADDGAAEAPPAGSHAESFSFNPDAFVDIGDGDAEAARAVWEQNQNQALVAAFQRAAEERKASGGPAEEVDANRAHRAT
jgi:hypothetical protein